MQINKKNLDLDFIKKWSSFGIDSIVLSILSRRDFTDEQQLLEYFFPTLEGNINPFDFTQIVKAYERIEKAIINNEKIIVFGDKDVDGTSSVAIITDWLETLVYNFKSKSKIQWEVPTGSNQYGLSAEKVNSWAGKYNLCITVDCGITNVSEVGLLSTYNIDTIIIDHHENLETLPSCIAIINPMCEPNIIQKKIAACVVVYLFIVGYCIYKSKFFNIPVGIFYTKDGLLFYDIYTNLKLTKSVQYDKLSVAQPSQAQFNYFLADKNIFSNDVSQYFAQNKITPVVCSDIFHPKLLEMTSNKSYLSKIAIPKIIYAQIKSISDVNKRYLCLSTLGTVADVMPLLGINRAIVQHGLDLIRKGTLQNIADMVKRARLNLETITSKDLAWTICPLLNASGRMGDATITVFFFRERNNSGFYLDAIFDNNKQRKDFEEYASNMFKAQYNQNPSNYKDIAFFYSDKIHKGVTGIVAAQISKFTGVPAIIAAKDGDLYVGSMRGDSNISCVDFLTKMSSYLQNFGGHHAAAGFSLDANLIVEFAQQVFENGKCLTMKEDTFNVDANIPISYLNYDLIKRLAILEPCGQDNPSPLLFTEKIQVDKFVSMGNNGAHLRLIFKTDKEPLVGIYWSKAKWFKSIHKPENKYNIIYKIETNFFNGVISPQLIISDMEVCTDE